MLNENLLLERYNKLPEWLRWIIFLPISGIFSVILWFFIDIMGKNVGAFEFVLEILHPVIVQILFLTLVFYTVPHGKLKWVSILIIIRSLFLVCFIAQPILIFLGANLQYDWIFFKELAGEIITLIASIWLFKDLKHG
jgi:hypothetical protein